MGSRGPRSRRMRSARQRAHARAVQPWSRARYWATKSQPTISLYASISFRVIGPGTWLEQSGGIQAAYAADARLVQVRQHSSAL